LDSILAQSFKDLEVVLVDDCSDQSCLSVVAAYRDKGLKIVAIRNDERLFAYGSRMVGIKAARGEIIGFADADDALWGTEALKGNVALFRERHADTLHFRTITTDKAGAFVSYSVVSDPFAPFLEGDAIFNAYAKTNIWGTSSLWNKLFSRSLCLRAVAEAQEFGFTPRWREDMWMCIILLSLARRYAGSDLAGYGYVYEDKRVTTDPGRLIGDYDFLSAVLSLLQRKNYSGEVVASFRNAMEDMVRGNAEHLSRALFRTPEEKRDAAIKNMLTHPDVEKILQALFLANFIDSVKLRQIRNLYYYKMTEYKG
jgi:glycosyltransferase involved in cell wall biosynthesis